MAYSAKWGGYEIVTDPESGTTYSCGQAFIDNKFLMDEGDTIVPTATNTTSADVYLYDDSQSKYYVFKTFCPDRITAYYSPLSTSIETKLLGNAERVWSEEIDCDVVETDSTTGDEIVIPYKMALLSNSGYTSERVTSYTFKNTNEKKCKYAVLPSVGDDLLGAMPVGMFKGCTELTKVKIPCNIESIPNDAFSGCTSLSSCTNGMETMERDSMDFIVNIGDKAFADCTSLTEAVIGMNVMSLGTGCFSGCTNISAITYDGAIGNNYGLVPNGRLKAIPEKAFFGCSSLSSATFYTRDTTSEYDPYSLDGYILPDDIETIGASAFTNCVSLSDFVAPRSLSGIGRSAFMDSGLINLDLSNAQSGLTIGIHAFSGITNSDASNNCQIKFPTKPMASIGNYAFYGCSGITDNGHSIEGTTNLNVIGGIGNGAFQNCSKWKDSFHITASTIGQQAFAGCASIPSISVNTNSIGVQAFALCSGITAATLTTDNIASKAFSGCSGMRSLVINGTNTTESSGTTVYINDNSFSGCSGLTNITINAWGLSDTQSGIGMFSSCTAVTITTANEEMFKTQNRLFTGSGKEITLPSDVVLMNLHNIFDTGQQTFHVPSNLISSYHSQYSGQTNWTFTAITTN